jgi:predicted nucleic-acid-binding protein
VKGADTNALVRFIVEDDEDQVRRAVKFLTRDCSVENPCFVNRIVICEEVWVLQTAYRYSRENIANAVGNY